MGVARQRGYCVEDDLNLSRLGISWTHPICLRSKRPGHFFRCLQEVRHECWKKAVCEI